VLRISLKNLLARKRRLAGTFFAVFLGVAFLSGTLVLGDTLKANFDSLFADANAGTDAVVRNASEVRAQNGATRGSIDAPLLPRVQAVAGVASAEPYIEGYGQLIGKDGKGIGGNGPPRIAANWITAPALNAYRLVQGRGPQDDGEAVINRGAAKTGHLKIGDVTTVQTPEPVRIRIVGIATFGSADGFGKSTYTALTLRAAQHHLIKDSRRVSSIRVKATPGVSQQQLVQLLDKVLPPGVQAITGDALTKENTDQISGEFLGIFRAFLLVFAAIALLVATFSINNTLSILVAQRTRESALLRALGASRRQVLVAVIAEALMVGIAASIVGLFAGLGLATGLKRVFDAFGGALPDNGLVFNATTAVLCLIVGGLVTVIAGLLPALKAGRVAPVAALRDVSLEAPSAPRSRTILGAGLCLVGAALVATALIGGGGAIALAGAGAVLIVAGVVAFGPVAAGPASALIGAPLARLGGVTGTLARSNAMRNPRRTSGTAAALMVGIGVVTLFTVVAASLKSSIEGNVARSFGGDLAVTTPGFGGGGLNPQLAAQLGRLPQVGDAVGIGTGAAVIRGHSQQLGIVEPERLGEVLDLGARTGSIRRLDDRQIAVSEHTASDKGWKLGSAVGVRYADGSTARLTVGATYANKDVAGDYLITRRAWAPHAVQGLDSVVFVTLKRGVSVAAGKAAVERVTRTQGAPDVRTRAQYIASRSSAVNQLLGIVYVMLILAIAIALMSIANTLSLSIHERTRELGLLRAVGASRRQVRAMVRRESVIVSLFGTIGGVLLGLFLGWAVVRAAIKAGQLEAFSAPIGQVLAVLLVGAAIGVIAGLRPARRAARLNVLDALATE